MRYMLLIHQGTTPVPGTDAWEKLSEEEQKQVYADYATINKTPGVTPADSEPPETATTVRVEGGETLTTDGPFVSTKEACGYLLFEAGDLDAAIELASRIRRLEWAAPSRCARLWSGSHSGPGLPRRVGPCPRHADRLPRRLRSRRGGGSGGLRDRPERWPREGTPTTPARG